MQVDHTYPDVRYWSEVLCCTIPTHMNDLKVKDLEQIYVKVFRSLYFLSLSLILLILCLILDTTLKFYAAQSPPLTNLEVKVTDFEILA